MSQDPFSGADPERIVAAWRAGVLKLSPEKPPCPGMIWAGWPGVHAGMLAFLDKHGVLVVQLGFGTRALFGVHRLAAALRVDSSGALVKVTWSPVATMEPGVIRFANSLVFRG